MTHAEPSKSTGGSLPTGPLAGVRILDLSAVVMGPYATQILGDLGADVIKVEPPAGDNMRAVGPMRHDNMGALYLHLNRNKRSVALNLKTPEGRQACLDLARNADVLLYNTRPQAMARLGLGYSDLQAVNPAIVYVGAYGFGQAGPYAGRPAYDDLIQGMTALPWLHRQSSGESPRYVPLTLADRAVGMHVAIAMLAGVIEARQSGEGQEIEIPMFETMSHMVLGDHLGGHTFDPAEGPAGYARLLVEHRRPYATTDGYISALIYNDKHWRRFFELSGQPERLNDPRFNTHTARAQHIDQAYAFVSSTIATNSSAHWLRLLAEADIPAAPLYSLDDLMLDPHLQAAGTIRHLDHPSEGRIRSPAPVGTYSRTPTNIWRHAPALGEHTRSVLAEAGYDPAHIETLLASGAAIDAAAHSEATQEHT